MVTRILEIVLRALLFAVLVAGSACAEARKIVLFVHGVNGDAESTWRTVLDRGNVEPQVITATAGTVAAVPPADHYSMDFTEPQRRFNVPISGSLIAHQAGELASAIAAIRRAPGNEDRPIVLVAHSRGGMVTREYLAGARFTADRPRIEDVVFIGVPHLLHARVRSNDALPSTIRYHTLVNPSDRLVPLSQQLALFEQQPALLHRQLRTTDWSDHLGHQIGGAPADQLWAALEAVSRAQGWDDRFTPYQPTRKGIDAFAWAGHGATTAGGAALGALVGHKFGLTGSIVGGVVGAFVGASLVSGGRWAVGDSLLPRARLIDDDAPLVAAPVSTAALTTIAPAAPSTNEAGALRRWQAAMTALRTELRAGVSRRSQELLREVDRAKAALDRLRSGR